MSHERDYLRDALSRSMGGATVSEIQTAFEEYVRHGAFVLVEQAGPHHADQAAAALLGPGPGDPAATSARSSSVPLNQHRH